MIPKAIDHLCDEFEAALKRNQPVRIEDQLNAVDGDLRPQLLYELLGIEIEFDARHGRATYLDELSIRFEKYPESVSLVLRSFLWEGSGFSADEATWTPQIRQFRLKAIVGRGAYGTVWLAHDGRLDREVAIKTPHGYGVFNAGQTAIREAAAAARLRHPHILQVHEVAEYAGRWLMVTDYVSGGTLKQLLETHQLSCSDVCRFGAQLADALHHAHAHGVYHRDLKPSNILVDERGNLLIADFGLAVTAQQAADDRLSEACGTVAYMAPEQAAGRIGGERADLYSLGVVLEDLLEAATSSASVEAATPKPGEGRMLTRALGRVRDRCCHLDPAQRYPSAEALATDLHRLAEGRPPRGVRNTRREVAVWFLRRHWTRLGLAAAAFVVGAAVWSAGPAPHPDSRRVRITTDPPGCRVALVPLDRVTRDPVVDQIQHVGRTPAEMNLIPGDYLVVAVESDERFHEVFRHVPERGENIPLNYPHQSWRIVDGVITLPSIKVHGRQARLEMAAIPDNRDFLVTREGTPADLAQRLRVPGFFASRCPVSRRAILAGHGDEEASADAERTPHNLDTAIMMAEQEGLRLPSAAEYALLTAMEPQNPGARLAGLDDNRGEWTTSCPGAIGTGLLPPPENGRQSVLIMGLAGTETQNSLGELVYRLAAEDRPAGQSQLDIESRPVRSARPRRSPEDFPTATLGIARRPEPVSQRHSQATR